MNASIFAIFSNSDHDLIAVFGYRVNSFLVPTAIGAHFVFDLYFGQN